MQWVGLSPSLVARHKGPLKVETKDGCSNAPVGISSLMVVVMIETHSVNNWYLMVFFILYRISICPFLYLYKPFVFGPILHIADWKDGVRDNFFARISCLFKFYFHFYLLSTDTDLEYTILFRANVYVKIYNDNTIRTSPSVYYYSFDIHYKWAAYTGTQNGIDIFNFDIHTYAM